MSFYLFAGYRRKNQPGRAHAGSDGGLNWKEAISLIMMYVLFVVVESYIKTLQ